MDVSATKRSELNEKRVEWKAYAQVLNLEMARKRGEEELQIQAVDPENWIVSLRGILVVQESQLVGPLSLIFVG